MPAQISSAIRTETDPLTEPADPLHSQRQTPDEDRDSNRNSDRHNAVTETAAASQTEQAETSQLVVGKGGGSCGRRSLLAIPASESHRRMPVKVRFHRRGRLSRQSPVSSQSDNPRPQGSTLRVHPRHSSSGTANTVGPTRGVSCVLTQFVY